VLRLSWSVFDIADKRQELARIEEQSAQPGFWDDARTAQQLMQQAARLRNDIEQWNSLSQRIKDALDLAQLEDESLRPDLENETTQLTHLVERAEFTQMLSGEYDREDAILAIHMGNGGVDAMDWAEMLERMYLRWCEMHGYRTEILDRSVGEEDGIKSSTIAVSGEWGLWLPPC
jgi:peptide chain release factor 2